MRKKFTIAKTYNCAVIQVSRQTRMTIYDRNGVSVFSDKSNTNEVSALVDPGDYVIETDGRIKSVRSIKWIENGDEDGQ